MNKILIITFLLLIACVSTYAQQFSKAIGIRGGLSSGFEYRFYTDDVNSYKLLLSARNNATQITALKEFHQYDVAGFSDQVEFIFGLGVHAGFERWHKKYYNSGYTWYETKTSFITGLDGLAALEYTFIDLPLCAGIEVKPYFNVWGRKTFDVELFDFAFTLKYLF
ncbi:MAG: hypothetical protein JXR31_16045 [Prolixibacteraceae bacterium]|nr:hypothetical protein [Prolixibacteraceae bacterium]MBN2775768.1 hypothetical protein [Prolixibacteraceae bacterium]